MRTRLVRILALPLVAILVLLGIVAVRDVHEYRVAAATTGSVELTLAVQNLVDALQQERGLTSGLLGGNVGFRGEMDPARRRVDAEQARVTRLAAGDLQDAAAVRGALRQLDDLGAVRARVDAGQAPRDETFQYLTDRVAAFNRLGFGLEGVSDQQLRRALGALDALGEFKEQTTQERAFLNGVYSAGGFREGEYVRFAAMNGARLAALTQYRRQATGAQRARLDAVLDTGAASEAEYFALVAQRAADGRLVQVNPQSWWSALTTVVDGVRGTQQAVGTDIQDRADQLRHDALRDLTILVAMVLFCVGGAIVLMVVAGRSITRPLAALAAEAGDVASQRLPTAVSRVQSGAEDEASPPLPVRVPARASSEIHAVADALSRVQTTAYALASDQARLRRNTTDSLANLGRRNQNLLRRQLGFITRLEREEADPSVLANLFELDHLATRMRRNAESLLVLVGETPPRPWNTPLPITDVIRAAISEVEEYRRVTLRRIDEAQVVGTYVSNLAHIIAELVENGLAFSPPDQDVEIQGRLLGPGYLIAVTDQGVGLNPVELAKANARLRGEESFLLSPTRFLGHYVVGRLARDMGVDVQITPSPVTGVTARIMLPGDLLARPQELSGPGSGDRDAAVVSPTIAEIQRPLAAVPEPDAVEVRREATCTALARTAPLETTHWWQHAGPASPLPVPRAPGSSGAEVGAAPGVASVPGTVGAGGAGGVDRLDGVDLTRNGLPKRARRSGAGRPQRSATTVRPERPPTDDPSPTDLRRRLTSLRDGVLRGEGARGAQFPAPIDHETRQEGNGRGR